MEDFINELGKFKFVNPKSHYYSLFIKLIEVDNSSKVLKLDKERAKELVKFLQWNYQITTEEDNNV